MKEKSLNKTVAKFTYQGKYFEIDWLTDAGDGTEKVFDLFGGKGKNAVHLHQFEMNTLDKRKLIKEAKEAIEEHRTNIIRSKS